MPESARRANALTAARMDAYRKILETVKGVNLTAEATVENSMVTGDIIVSKVEGVVRGARLVGEPRYFSDLSVQVTYEMDLHGDLNDALLPATTSQGQVLEGARGAALCPTCGQPWPVDRAVPEGITLVSAGGDGATAGRGLHRFDRGRARPGCGARPGAPASSVKPAARCTARRS